MATGNDNKNQTTAQLLVAAARDGNVTRLKELVTGKNVNLQFKGKTALMAAAAYRNPSASAAAAAVSCVQLLLEAGADAALTDADGSTSMHLAADANNLDVLPVLPASTINARDRFFETPLMLATAANCGKTVHRLLSLGADPLLRNYAGWNAMQIARYHHCWSAYMELVKTSNRSHELPVTEEQKVTFLHQQRVAKHMSLLAMTGEQDKLQQVANSHNCNWKWKSMTPLMWASWSPSSISQRCMRMLRLQMQADCYAVDRMGWVAAHFAADADDSEGLSLLPLNSWNCRDRNGNTPLIVAVARRNFSAVQKLIGKGADQKLCNNLGLTAYGLAKLLGDKEMMDKINELNENLHQEQQLQENIKFCMRMMSSRKSHEDVIPLLRKIFKKYDSDGSGCIEIAELRGLIKKLDFSLDSKELNKILLKFDTDGNGELDFNEFNQVITKYDNLARQRLFDSIAPPKSSSISLKELGQLFSDEANTHNRLKDLMDKYDTDQSGFIDFQEFCNILDDLNFKATFVKMLDK